MAIQANHDAGRAEIYYLKMISVTYGLPLITMATLAALGIFNKENSDARSSTFDRELFGFWSIVIGGTSLFAGITIHLFNQDLAKMDGRPPRARKFKHLQGQLPKGL